MATENKAREILSLLGLWLKNRDLSGDRYMHPDEVALKICEIEGAVYLGNYNADELTEKPATKPAEEVEQDDAV